MSFETAFTRLFGLEGDGNGVANESDRGGATRFGITEQVARAFGYKGPMSALPLETARIIYKAQWWQLMKLDTVASYSEAIAYELFDTGVNMGQGTAVRFFQIALNAFNRRQKDYMDVAVDGVMGAVTLAALGKLIAKRGKDGETVMLRALNAQQGSRYLNIAADDQQQETFLFGWFLNRVS